MPTRVITEEFIEWSPANVRMARVQKRWSLAKLSEESNVHVDTLRRIERGVGDRQMSTMQDLARALECPIEHLTTDFEFKLVPVKENVS